VVGASLSTRETVLCETSAASAMSRIVVTERRALGDPVRAGVSSGVDDGPGALGDIGGKASMNTIA
jgi:hypothetical protein